MRALQLSDYRVLEIIDLPVPEPAAGEVLVQVASCGICGSDIHGYDGASGRRIPPLVMGHEAAGVVAAVGDGVSNVRRGDRITFDSTVYCGECGFCRRGEINLCDRRQVLGVSCGDYRRAGAFAEYIVVPSRITYPLPDNLSFVEAAMLEAVSVALHAVSLTRVVSADSTLVIGAGMIGLLIVQALRAAGVSHIIVTDLERSRLALAKEVGATEIVHGNEAEVLSQILQSTTSAGVDAAIEAVGLDDTVKLSIKAVRKGGRVTLVGNISPTVTLPLQSVVTRQICLQGSCASAGEYPKAIDLLASGTIRVKPLISAVAPLEQGPRWFERLYSREPNLMKVVLTPGATS
jgi:L-iditol 2-dehydrogenase